MSQLHALRMIMATVAAVALVFSLAPKADAHHLPKTYCSDTGDLCQSVRKVDGVRKLRIVLAGNYFHRFQLCVRDPEGSGVCEYYRIRERRDGSYGRSVAWRDHIWHQRTPGAYTVTWRLDDGTRIGRRLGFHRRAG